MNLDDLKPPSILTLARLRVFPTEQPGQWLVVGRKRDVKVHAESFFELLDAVRLAREISK